MRRVNPYIGKLQQALGNSYHLAQSYAVGLFGRKDLIKSCVSVRSHQDLLGIKRED